MLRPESKALLYAAAGLKVLDIASDVAAVKAIAKAGVKAVVSGAKEKLAKIFSKGAKEGGEEAAEKAGFDLSQKEIDEQLGGNFKVPDAAEKTLPKPNPDVIRDIKKLPDDATLTPEQATELGRNLDAILQKTLPGKVKSGRVEDVLKLLKTDARFRFLDQVPGARERILDAFKKAGVEFK